jgi:hypothetical protein
MGLCDVNGSARFPRSSHAWNLVGGHLVNRAEPQTDPHHRAGFHVAGEVNPGHVRLPAQAAHLH